MSERKRKFFIESEGGKIYVELGYPKKLPAPAIIVAHGLRSYYSGFLNMFAKNLRAAGYISVKFHFVGTGLSSGKFEHKTTTTMLKNFQDVLSFLSTLQDIRGIGVVARSNAGSLATLHGRDSRISAYVFLAPPAYYSMAMGKYVRGATVRGTFFYHPTFSRPHTKGLGRLPLSYVSELKKYDAQLKRNAGLMKRVIFFQSTGDEAVPMSEGHYLFWEKNLPRPRKMVLIQGSNHSYENNKKFVIDESIKWLHRFLPRIV